MANEARAARSQQSSSSPWFTSNLTMSKFAKIFKTSSSFNINLVHRCKLVFAELSLMYLSILKLLTVPVGAIHKHMRGLAQLKSS